MTRVWHACLVLGALAANSRALDGQKRPAVEPLAWQAASGPFTGNVQALAESETGTLFASIAGEIHRSTNDGVSWLRCPSQPARRPGSVNFDPWLVAAGRRLYSSGDSGGAMYVSLDDCESSRSVAPPPGMSGRRERVTFANGLLLAAYDNPPFFASSDEGQTWKAMDRPEGTEPRVSVRNGVWFAVLSQRLYRSDDRGLTWSEPGAQAGLRFHGVLSGGNSLFAMASGGVWRSRDNGQTWTRMFEQGLTAATARGARVFVSVFSPPEIARSLDDGNTWTRVNPPSPRSGVRALHETRRGTLLAASFSGIFRSTDNGVTWTATGIRGQRVHSFAVGGGRVYASLNDASLWNSADAGLTWSRVDAMYLDNPRPHPLSTSSPGPFVQMQFAGGMRLRAAAQREFVASNDSGATWAPSGLSYGVTALVRSRDTWFAATWQGVFRSTDLDQWVECSSGLEPGAVFALAATPTGDLIALQSFSTYRSQDGCASWWTVAGRLPFRGGDGYRGRSILVSDAAVGVAAMGDGIAQLSIADRKWIDRLDSHLITALARDSDGRYWLGTREGVFLLSIEGTQWRLAAMGLDGPVSALAIDPAGYLIAAVDGRGVSRARLP